MAQRKHLWPLFLLPVAAVLAFVWLGPPRGQGAENAAAPGTGNAPKVADLGGRARTLPAENAPANAAETERPPGPEPEGGEPPVEEPANSAREIDIYLGQLAHATKVNDARGQTLAHESLKKCRPHELVDERVLAALESERNAFVRAEFFAAFHVDEAKYRWALRALESKAAKYLGSDTNLEPGEGYELFYVYLEPLIVEGLVSAEAFEPKVLALVRNILNTEQPEAALTFAAMYLQLIRDPSPVPKLLEFELRGLLERGTASLETREKAFLWYAMAQSDIPTLLSQLQTPALRPYLATLVKQFRPGFPLDGEADYRWGIPLTQSIRAESKAIGEMCALVLGGPADSAEKLALIAALAAHEFPDRRELIESGLGRRDANQGAYLSAWGRIAQSEDDLKVLTDAAVATDPAAATGAIEGLRQCALPEAAAELARIVEQGGNPGLQSQALGALLARDSANAETVVEGYLGTDRDASVRAVAVAHIPAKNIERMKKVVNEDASPRVRQAALTRLGEMKDKKLRSYFLSVAINDPQPLIRQQAKKYADELKDE